MRPPAVYIIGAGPGDPGLITVHGRRCLEQADVVLYDHQVHARLLRWARADAERIDVGAAAPHPLEQEAICYLLAEKAREGKVVARLKWGDPYVFDQGGQEALFLHEQGVPFEVIPGVPACIGVPAYAGVPVTYPGGGDTLTFVRGSEGDAPARSRVDWASLARLDGTIVCYVGPRQAAAMIEALVAHGRSPDEPAALVYDGTLPSQETLVGTLEEVAAGAKQTSRGRAGILVIGRVARLREHLRWFDTRPLFGRRIVVTRPREQAGELVERLEALGAEAVEAPMIRLAPPDDFGPLDAACAAVSAFDWVVFTSVNGVDAFMRRLQAGPGDVRDLKGVRLCAIGPTTGERLARYGLKVDLIPAEYRAEAIVEALGARDVVRGRRFLLPRADIARELLAEELRRLGGTVTEVTAYRTIPADTDRVGAPDVYRMLLDRKVDAITFTSASTVRSFVKAYGAEQAADLLRTTVVAAIGPVTADAATQYGIRTTVMPADYTIPALVEALAAHFRNAPSKD